MIALAGAVLGFAAGASAREEPAGDDIVQAQISDAAHDLEQAALQRDFASNAHELALLQWAHEDLAVAAKELRGAQRTRTIELLADLDHAITRASSHVGPLLSPDGDTFGPLPPSRQELAQLATQARDVERNSAAR